MSKAITLFLIVALLLSSTLSYDARPIKTIPKAATSAPTTTTTIVTKSENKDDVDETCEGVRKEECLTRRTLAAHLDYIYTQDKNP
ncbi:phytosulfokine 3 [Artemisia annua]|uniref:Phytosulfokine n=1 Tax=Artemisia annua TaxID=35608 RepID=A0A2U1NSB2_ARTAN|nr:phytosulfokine 3 [Artemisia annua]